VPSQLELAEEYLKRTERAISNLEVGRAKIFGVSAVIHSFTEKWVWVIFGRNKKELRIPRHFLKGECVQLKRYVE
jgi:hypothetical protein